MYGLNIQYIHRLQLLVCNKKSMPSNSPVNILQYKRFNTIGLYIVIYSLVLEVQFCNGGQRLHNLQGMILHTTEMITDNTARLQRIH